MSLEKLQDLSQFLGEQKAKLATIMQPTERMTAAQFVATALIISPQSLAKMIRDESMPEYAEIASDAKRAADALDACAWNLGKHAKLWAIVEWAEAQMKEEDAA